MSDPGTLLPLAGLGPAGSPSPRRAIRAKLTPALVRPLGCGERFFHLYGLAYPVHFCLVAQIEGAIDAAKLRAALGQVRHRHAALRVRILDDPKAGPAFYQTNKPIELNVVRIRKDADWHHLVEAELNRPLDAVSGPLMRATATLASDEASIILTFHHAIADGLSGIHVLDDLLSALAGERLVPLRPLPPIEDLITGRPSAPPFAQEAPLRAAAFASAAADRGALRPMAHVSTSEWSQPETARLIERCKAAGTTVHGALCAAASRHVPAFGEETIRTDSPMDLRKMAGIDGGHCGVFVGIGVGEIPVRGRRSLWVDARDIADSLRAARSHDVVVGMLHRIATAFPPTASRERVGEFFAATRQSSIVVSNLGVVPLDSQYGSIALKAVWGPAMLTSLPARRQTIGISTFAGRLRMVHQSYQPIPGLLEALRKTLLACCS